MEIILILVGAVIGIAVQYFVIKFAVYTAMRELQVDSHPGSNYYKSIIKNAVKEAFEEMQKDGTKTGVTKQDGGQK
ncbi:MAG: hypothetical protein FWC89_12820 [Defluviitaleaceae bacterium]|nr:hypothetical protein [Defluviitaleaceae bacterium]